MNSEKVTQRTAKKMPEFLIKKPFYNPDSLFSVLFLITFSLNPGCFAKTTVKSNLICHFELEARW